MRRPLTAGYVVLAAADTFLAASGRAGARKLTKPLLMPVLLVGRDRPTQRALALGGVGDVALLGTSSASFTAGLGSFLVGHIAWMLALRGRSTGHLKGRWKLIVPYMAMWGLLNAYLWGRTGRDRIPVLLYSTALLGTALTALDTGNPITTTGGVLFLASDALIALDHFGDVHIPLHEGVVMLTYATAQGLLAMN